jgi:hypothetical protein
LPRISLKAELAMPRGPKGNGQTRRVSCNSPRAGPLHVLLAGFYGLAAGEGGHAPLKRGQVRESNRPIDWAQSAFELLRVEVGRLQDVNLGL